jgi:hypothetical protein
MDDLDKIIRQLETGASSKRKKAHLAKRKKWEREAKKAGHSFALQIGSGIPTSGLK